MRLIQQFLTKNDCYKNGRTIAPKGVMVHSTGANNPNVSRYVPGNDEIGYNTGGNHWDRPNDGVCVHAFIGKFADGSVGTVQTIPWNFRCGHCGKGKNGSANNTHIAFEICEDSMTDPVYFNAVYKEAVELTAMLCKLYGLNPLADGVVICHSEGHSIGIASNHADVMHWFPKFGKTMDTFREDVARFIEEGEEMTQEQFDKMMDDYLLRRSKLPATMPELFSDAKEMGLTDGSRPRSFATREECAVMIRAAVLSHYQN